MAADRSGTSLAGGRYRVERLLGHGGMASVYLARDEELDRPVAIKLLAQGLAGDAAFRERFLREARVAARLSHPNVVRVYDAGEDAGRPYIVMEPVEGETLADLLTRRGALPAADAVALTRQACLGLWHAHADGLVHRDIKPANLLLGRDGTLKIADFGIARAVEGTALTQAGTVLGTAAYLAPEQAEGTEVTAAADIYSLGAVLYELLTGKPPYEVGSLDDLAVQRRAGSIAPVRELAPEVTPHLEETVMRCLARNPAYRPSSAVELARELEPQTTDPATDASPVVRALSRDKRLWLALAGALAVAGALLAVALALGAGGGSTRSTPRVHVVQPVPHGSSAQQQARDLAAWLRRYSARR